MRSLYIVCAIAVLSETLTVEMTGPQNWIPFIVGVISILILIYLIWVYSVKKKFPLDIQLCEYKITDYRTPVNYKNMLNKPKTLFSPGVIDPLSAGPWPCPFRIRLSAVDKSYGNIMLVAMGGDQAYVINVAEKEITTGKTFRTAARQRVRKEPTYKIIDSNQRRETLQGYANIDNLSNSEVVSRYGNVLLIQDTQCLQEQPYSDSNPKKLLRFIRKKHEEKSEKYKGVIHHGNRKSSRF